MSDGWSARSDVPHVVPCMARRNALLPGGIQCTKAYYLLNEMQSACKDYGYCIWQVLVRSDISRKAPAGDQIPGRNQCVAFRNHGQVNRLPLDIREKAPGGLTVLLSSLAQVLIRHLRCWRAARWGAAGSAVPRFADLRLPAKLRASAHY